MANNHVQVTLDLTAQTDQLNTALNTVKKNLSSVLDSNKQSGLQKIIDNIEKDVTKLRELTAQPLHSQASFDSAEKLINKIILSYDKLGEKMTDITNLSKSQKIELLPPDQATKINNAIKAVDNYKNSIISLSEKTKEQEKLEKDLAQAQKQAQGIADKIKEKEGIIAVAEAKKESLQATLNLAKKDKEAASQNVVNQKQKITQLQAEYNQLQENAKATEKVYEANKKGTTRPNKQTINGQTYDLKGDREALAAKSTELAQAQQQLESLIATEEQYANVEREAETNVRNNTSTINNNTKSIQTLQTKYEAQINTVDKANKALEEYKNELNSTNTESKAKAVQQFAQEAEKLGISMEGIDMSNPEQAAQLLEERLQTMADSTLQNFDNSMQQTQGTIQSTAETTAELKQKTDETAQSFERQNETAGEVSGFVSRIKQFTGLTGAALIARRALRAAFNTIKELDKQMTEMAVVTNFQVGDFWKQMPEHTAHANALGMAIKDVYEAETLYYQQGLKTAQVTALTNSTLKMARIAGLSAEDATNKMTAALRGFNMEINETNADRIADVYSKLAAITASNVQEISSAMTKTASIASSAGMEFETTAAFLSQIIETTRESAETAGTALKTVIARFQELKKSPDEIGEVDGEIIDANKIETALRSVGVALRDTQGQFRNLDDVFIELAGKWDTLDMNTQRYIATIAAGSRQQSRFVAMMSNYSRTQELVTAANNAAGASNEQFEKTLESLETALNKLQNAWNSFTMGILNSDALKAVLNALTKILNAVNGIADAFGSWGGLAVRIGLVTVALIAGEKAIRAFTTSMKAGSNVAVSFGAALKAPFVALHNFNKRLLLGIKNMFGFSRTINTSKTVTNQYAKAQTDLKNKLAAADAADKKLAASEAVLNKEKTKSEINTEALAQAEKDHAICIEASDKANKDVAASEAALAAATGLTTAQVKEAVAIEALGTDQKIALWLASKGVTAQSVKEAATKLKVSEADVLNILTGKKEAETKMGGWLASKMMSIALQWESKGKIKAAISTHMLTWANQLLQASMWAIIGVILVIVATIALLTLAIIGLVKWIKWLFSNPAEDALEAANESLKSATASAEAATEAYNNLKDSIDSINDKYDALDALVIGTEEWRDALLEVNELVMNLIDSYPELAQNVQVDENGVLRLDKEAQKLALHQAASIKARAQNAKLEAANIKRQATVNLRYSQLSDEAVAGDQSHIVSDARKIGALLTPFTAGLGYLIGESIGKTNLLSSRRQNQEITDKFAGDLASGTNPLLQFTGKNQIDKDNFIKYAYETLHMNQEEALAWYQDLNEDAIKSLKEYGEAVNKNTKATEAATQTMIANAQALLDASKYTIEQQKQMSNIGTEALDYWINYYKSQFSGKGKYYWATDADYLEYWQGMYENVSIDDFGEVKYTDDNGEEQSIKGAEAVNQYATAKATEDFAKQMGELPKALSTLATNLKAYNPSISGKNAAQMQKGFAHAMDDRSGLALTRLDLNVIDEYTLEDIWNSSPYFQKLYGTIEAFRKDFNTRRDNAQQAYDANTKKLTSLGLDKELLNPVLGLDAASEKGLVEHLEQIVVSSGTGTATKLGNSLNNLLIQLGEEERKKFVTQLNAIDWHNATDLEQLPQTLKELDLALPIDDLEAFIKDTKTAAHAIHNIDMSKLTEQLVTLNKTIENININEQKRSFDDSTYKAIIDMVPSLVTSFSADNDGNYIYLGNSLNDLRMAIIDNTSALVEEKQAQLDEKIAAADILDAMTKQTYFDGEDQDVRLLSFAESWTKNNKISYIKEFLDEASSKNLQLSAVSNYLSDISDPKIIEKLDESVLDTILKDLRTVYGNQAVYRKEIVDSTRQAEVSNLIRENVYYSARSTAQAKAETDNLSSTDITSYQAARRSVTQKAVKAGISEAELQRLQEYNTQLEKFESVYDKLTENSKKKYQQLAKQANTYMQIIASKSAYEEMYNGLQSNIEKNRELMETYKETTDEQHKALLLNSMISEFGLEVTEENMSEMETYVDSFLNGNEESFKALVNAAGTVVGTTSDVFDKINAQTMTTIKNLGPEYLDFVKQMVDAGYGYINATTDTFYFGLDAFKSIIEDIKDEIEQWISPYDWLWNTEQKLNAELLNRNRLEREYSRMLTENTSSIDGLANNLNSRVLSLDSELKTKTTAFTQYQEQLQRYINPETNQPYAKWLEGVIGIGANGQVTIDKDALRAKVVDADAGDMVESEVDEILRLVDGMTATEKDIWDIQDELEEINDTGHTEFDNLLNRTVEALRNNNQAQIDKLSDINEAINDARESLLTKLQEKIEEDRAAREEQKTLDSLEDKQSRLAYLQASGGDPLEILRLQKELDSETESYTDSLIDKSISEMEKANAAAADQRQQQIDIAQAQFDWWSSHDALNDANNLVNQHLLDIANGLDPQTTSLGKFLFNEEGVSSQTKSGIEDWYNTLSETSNLAAIYSGLHDQESPLPSKLSSIETLSKTSSTAANNAALAAQNVGSVLSTMAIGKKELVNDKKQFVVSDGDVQSKLFTLNKNFEEWLKKQSQTPPTIPTPPPSLDQTNSNIGVDTSKKTLQNSIQGRIAQGNSNIAMRDTPSTATTSLSKGTIQANNNVHGNIQRSGTPDVVHDENATQEIYQDLLTEGHKLNRWPEAGTVIDSIEIMQHVPKAPDYITGGLTVKGAGGTTDVLNYDGHEMDPYNWAMKQAIPANHIFTYSGKNSSTYGLYYLDREKRRAWRIQGGWARTIQNLLSSEDIDKIYSIFEDEQNGIIRKFNGTETGLQYYVSGGLADFTGPAWLDGTKSAPELVLNATDTANFIQLKDILSEILRGSTALNSKSTSTNSTSYNIEVHVDSIASDYDVDQAVERMKELIETDAMYRNVTSVNKTR